MSRSFDTPSGSTARKRTPRAAQAMANAIDVDPLDASTTVVPAWTRPVSTARRSTWAASRSLVDPLGSWYSSLSQMVQPDTGSSSATVGVVASTSAVRRSGSNGRWRGVAGRELGGGLGHAAMVAHRPGGRLDRAEPDRAAGRQSRPRPDPSERARASTSASVPCAAISSWAASSTARSTR